MTPQLIGMAAILVTIVGAAFAGWVNIQKETTEMKTRLELVTRQHEEAIARIETHLKQMEDVLLDIQLHINKRAR